MDEKLQIAFNKGDFAEVGQQLCIGATNLAKEMAKKIGENSKLMNDIKKIGENSKLMNDIRTN